MRSTLIAVPMLLLMGVAGAAGCAGDARDGSAAGPGPGAAERPGAPGGGLPAGRAFVSTAVTQAGAPKPLVAGTSIRLRILDGGRIAVQAGCNTALGQARLDAERLVVDGLLPTVMGCEEARHQQDEWIFAFFESRPVWRLDGDTLVLTGTDLEVRMTGDKKATEAARTLVGPTPWTLDTLVSAGTASSVPAGTAAFITFAPDGKVTGSTGCNSFGGTAKVDGKSITFGELTMTKMACDGAAGDLEGTVLRVLAQPLTYRIEGTRLFLEAPDGSALQLVG